MTLDDLVKEAARRGDLRSLTLWTVEAGYQANVSADGKSWRVEHDADPVAALKKALAPRLSVLATDTNQEMDIFG